MNNLEQVHNHLGLHFSPGLFLLVPGYALFPSPYYLLIVQTIALALGAWPLFLLAKKYLVGSPSTSLRARWPLIIAGAYLLYPSLHWANMYDFHEITFFVPLMLAALYFLEEKRWGWMTLFLAFAASMKEDAILAVFFVGVYMLTTRREPVMPANAGIQTGSRIKSGMTNKLFGISIIVLSLIYFILAVKVIMPALGGGVLRLDRYANLGTTPIEMVKNAIPAVLSGSKLLYLLWLFLPVSFLLFFSWQNLILLLPGLPENLLTDYQFQFSGLYHYDAILIPAVFIGTIFGLKKVLTRWPSKEIAIRWALISLAVISFLLRSPLGVFSFPANYFSNNPQREDYRRLVALVPEGVSVAANTNLVPHISHREFVFPLRSETLLPDMVIIDAADLFQFKDMADLQSYIDNYLATGLYKAQGFNDRYVVLYNNKLKLIPQTE